MVQRLRIGTRGSRLALIQAGMVLDALRPHYPDLKIEIVKIETSGDWKPADGEMPLPEASGGKANFAKEIEEALLAGYIDCGVHSLKDMAAMLPPGLVVEHMLPRADPRDAFLANDVKTLDEMRDGAVVGTSSPRRRAFLLARRPDLRVVMLRGNVPTRIEKLRNRQVDATLLALAGLQRLGLEHEAASLIEVGELVPAACQGIVGIELREGDAAMREVFDPIHCCATGLRAAAERAAVAALEGTCQTPIGAHAMLTDGVMTLDVALTMPDGVEAREKQRRAVASVEEARELGRDVGALIQKREKAA